MGAGRLFHHGLAPVAREQWRTSGPHRAAGGKQDEAKMVQGPKSKVQCCSLKAPACGLDRPRGLAASSLPLKPVAGNGCRRNCL